jgi:cell division protein FtsI (penicillin-binding protein 3)
VVIDTPKGDYYGTSVSAPVFAEVAQQVLEYLGVPHDIDLKPATTAKAIKPATEDDSSVDERDIQALYQAANDLPNDDPLRGGPQPVPEATKPTVPVKNTTTALQQAASPAATAPPAATPQQSSQTVTVADPNKVRVPSFMGLSIRKVIEQAAAAGLEVQIVGNGTCRQQAPDPGAMVARNTKIIVRCGH